MSFLHHVKMLLKGYIYVGDQTCPGWSGPLPFYRFICPKHGEVETYPAGYTQRLQCPKCLDEQRKRTDPKIHVLADEPIMAKSVQGDEQDEHRLDGIPSSNPREPERR